MNDQVLELLPEINEIRDIEIKDKVVACWQEAIAYRDWTNEELKSIPFTLLAENINIFFIEHVRTCCRMAIACNDVLDDAYGTRKTPVNRDYLIAGSLLADVGKLFEYEKKPDGSIFKSDYGKHIRHPFSGVGLAYKHGLPSEVMHVIATHSKEGDSEKRLPESIIFHHVDFIDFELVK
ncbi:MAG: phosphohydrolase [Caldithrix sp.]|nr:phosphohydrolase [Caldithrix sp.]